MRQEFSCILIAFALVGCTASYNPEASKSVVRAALAERYPAADVIHERELQFEGEAPVEPVDLPALSKALPDVRFYTTKLHTGYYEYPQVSVAVAVPKQGQIAAYLSPTYSKSDPAFIELLMQARVSGASDERAVADEIARLFALITHKGEIRDAHCENGEFAANLWHGDLLWRRVSITFAKGQVSTVSLTNPKESGKRPAA